MPGTETSPSTSGSDDRQLQIDLRRFDLSDGPSASAEVAFSAKILSGDGHLLQTRTFEAQIAAAAADERAGVRALNEAFAETTRQLAAWLGGQS